MALEPGSRLGPYTITASIGAGGMGEVYKSTDTRLDRTVAVKVLPQHVASDPELKERFELEAKTLAALTHPHICSVFDVGSQNGVDFLVMEYLEGETLEQRLLKGPLPLDHALQLGIQTADALAAAHRAGIIHRDLKPGNIMLTKTGARLLDFGLAKTCAPAMAGNLSLLPTTPPHLTVAGTVLGTFQYMAPEQVEGQEADARTDIFAFGAVLYEMLTGRKAFAGKSQASLLGAILKDQPAPVAQLQPMTPPALEYLIRTCLAKDPDARFQTAHDVLLQLRWIAEGGSAIGVPAPVVARRKHRERVGWVVAAVFAAIAAGTGALAVIHVRERAVTPDVVQFTVTAEANSALVTPADFVISPDGRQIVFLASRGGAQEKPGESAAPNSVSMLWVRHLDT